MLLKVVLPVLSTGIIWKVGQAIPQSLAQICVSQKLMGHKNIKFCVCTHTHTHTHTHTQTYERETEIEIDLEREQ